jgi:hypothetical protein
VPCADADRRAGALGQPAEPIAAYYGFEPHRIIVVNDGCGPGVSADFNKDGRPDVAVVNNAKSRIELHFLRATERTTEEMSRTYRVNELPPQSVVRHDDERERLEPRGCAPGV